MQLLLDTYEKAGMLHHAYLIEGSTEKTLSDVTTFLEQRIQFTCQANPDYHYSKVTTFSISDARTLTDRANRKPLGKHKIFVIVFESITHEAQNALLKLFEEPSRGVHFFLLTRTAETLFSTLRSRLFVISKKEVSTIDEKTTSSFLKKSKADRLKFLKKMIEEKDKQDAIRFVDGLEQALCDDVVANAHALQEIEQLKRYLHDRSPSAKMILEHIALTIPSPR
jgi:DNA polymerase III delta prime subunit